MSKNLEILIKKVFGTKLLKFKDNEYELSRRANKRIKPHDVMFFWNIKLVLGIMSSSEGETVYIRNNDVPYMTLCTYFCIGDESASCQSKLDVMVNISKYEKDYLFFNRTFFVYGGDILHKPNIEGADDLFNLRMLYPESVVTLIEHMIAVPDYGDIEYGHIDINIVNLIG